MSSFLEDTPEDAGSTEPPSRVRIRNVVGTKKITRTRGLITSEGLEKGLPIFTQAQEDIREAFKGF